MPPSSPPPFLAPLPFLPSPLSFSEPFSHFSAHALSWHSSPAFRHRPPAPPPFQHRSTKQNQTKGLCSVLFGRTDGLCSTKYGRTNDLCLERPSVQSYLADRYRKEEGRWEPKRASVGSQRGAGREPVLGSRGDAGRARAGEWRKDVWEGGKGEETGRRRAVPERGKGMMPGGDGEKMEPGGALLGAASEGERRWGRRRKGEEETRVRQKRGGDEREVWREKGEGSLGIFF